MAVFSFCAVNPRKMKPYLFNKRVKTKIWVTIQVDSKMKISRRGKIFIDHLTLVAKNVESLPHRYYTGIIPVYFHSFNRIKIPFGISNSFQSKGINKKTQPMASSKLFWTKIRIFSIFIQIDGESSDDHFDTGVHVVGKGSWKKREVGNF